MNDDAFYGVCVHEAAHALAAIRLRGSADGAPAAVERAIARRDLVSVADAHGNAASGVYGAVLGGRIYDPRSPADEAATTCHTNTRRAFLEAVKALTGPVAELSIGEAQVPSSVDDVLLADHGGERDLLHVYDVLRHSDQLDRIEEARSVACRFVRDHWRAMVAVAGLLYERGEVWGDEISDLSLQYQPRRGPR